MTFLLLSIGYIFLFFASIYGLCVKEVSLGFVSLKGVSKNILCGFGLLLASLIGVYPVFLGLYNALSNASG